MPKKEIYFDARKELEEAMRLYIRRTQMKEKIKYSMRTGEIQAAFDMISRGMVFEAIILIFNYGRAKGYRMAKKELHHG